MSDIKPLVVVFDDKFDGVYSGGKWTAWNRCYVPSKIFADAKECEDFFSTPNLIYGRGETPQEAIDDLKMVLDCGISDPDEKDEDEEDEDMEPTSVWEFENLDNIGITLDDNEISLLLRSKDGLTKIILTGDAAKYYNDNFDIVSKTDIEEYNKVTKEIEKKMYKLEEKIKKLEHDDMLDKNAADYWSKEHDILLERFAKLQAENEKLKDKVEHVEPFRALEQTIREKHQLKEENENLKKHIKRHADNCRTIAQRNNELREELALEKAANEAQHKFFRQYAGKGTEIEFNYAIGDTDEVSYVIVDKERYQTLKDNGCNVTIHDKDYTPMQLIDRIFELERLKTPTIENFSVEEHSDQSLADNVNHPSHYTGRYECIDVMQDVFGDEATNDFCLCNAFKYIWRARKKNGLEDVKKAVWYLNKYIEEAEKDGKDKVTGA